MKESLPDNTKLTEIEDILISFSLSILEKETEDEVVWGLVKNCISALDMEDCVVYFIDFDRGELVQKAAHGPKNPKGQQILSPLVIPMGKGITGYVAVTGEPLIIENTELDHRYIEDDVSRLSEICVPIQVDDQVIGVIDCEHSRPNFFTDEHLRILTVIARICAIKLSQLKSEELRNKQMEETHLVKLQLSQLQTKMLKSHLNPHFVFNTLNSIQYFLTENNKVTALNYLSLFSKIIRYYLGNFENELVFLNHEIDALSNYLLLQKLRYESRFGYFVEKAGIEALQENELPPLLLITMAEEILENHLSDSDTLKLRINLNRDEAALILTFTFNHALGDRSSSGYRQSMISWKEQIQFFNELKGRRISYEIERDSIDTTYRITIPQNL
ncbi:MAG: histidine kinase [Ekhidna sp.]|uniref:histidine kinase n=1 Tax=Ekhidna sp. TaxID=2608089 RepID=UPI0032EEB77E